MSNDSTFTLIYGKALNDIQEEINQAYVELRSNFELNDSSENVFSSPLFK